MDGVPVKISEKYKPPKRISLPGSVLNKIAILKETKVDDYDFSFERAVLAQVGRIREYKKSVEEKKKKADVEKQKESEEDNLTVVSAGCQQQATSSPPSPPSESDRFQIPQTTVSANMDMLAPLPVTNTALGRERRKIDNSILSEFESDTSSPFDNMELKSINDLQELADVLGSSAKTGVQKEEKPLNGITHSWRTGEQRSYGYPCQYPGYPAVYPMYQGYSPVRYTYPASPTYVSPVPPPLPPKPPALSSNPTHSSPAHRNPTAAIQYPTGQSESPPQIDPIHLALWSDLQTTVQDRRTALQHQMFNKPQGIGLFGGVTAEHLPSPDDSLSKLSPEGQSLARRMSEMGFPLDRSARAVQLFNSDEAKVIEFLLQVQKFEDREFPGDLVESVLLESTDMSEDALSDYLMNIKKLMDFGFSKERVVKAMEQAGKDTNRALDILIS